MIVSETFNFLQRDLFEEARTLYFAQRRLIWKLSSQLLRHIHKRQTKIILNSRQTDNLNHLNRVIKQWSVLSFSIP